MNSTVLDTRIETKQNANKKVTIIPATKSLHPERDGITPNRAKVRVAAYCRVSTTMEEQQGSYKLQNEYYKRLIENNPAWELVGIYGDEGKSGTSLKGRTGFLEMMDDVRAGRIDYIITKTTSRFGRNNADFIEILDELDSYGVEVLFESEGIITSGQQNRTMLQVMGATNEHYSNQLSNNIRWSKERNMKKGKVTFCYKNFLGYEKGEDGEPKIVEEEAEIVRKIYQLFLEENPYSYIADYLTSHNIPTPAGRQNWTGGTVKSILTNEKYTGDALLQKTFKRSYLDKRARRNNGEKPQIIVENNHPAIIDKPTFARVQELVKKRSCKRNSGTKDSPFVGKVVCADCGDYFGHKTWTSRGRIKYSMWVCNHKYTEETSYGGDKCKTANLREEWLEQGYLYTINYLLAHRTDITAKYERKLEKISHRLQSGTIEKELEELAKQSTTLKQELETLKKQWEYTFGDHTAFYTRQQELKTRSEEIVQKTTALEEERQSYNTEKILLQNFIRTLNSLPSSITKFKPKDFINTIDHIEVKQFILVYYVYGSENVKVNVNLLKKMCK